jgi:hypothetical protein
MHKKTYSIIKNLGFSDEVIKSIKLKQKNTKRKLISSLKNLGVPDSALKQIKLLEKFPVKKPSECTNADLIKSLVKRCKRSLDAFANKGVRAKIVFSDNSWTIYSSDYSKEIEKLHSVCKNYFDEWSARGMTASFYFDSTSSWKIIVAKKTDLPTNEKDE